MRELILKKPYRAVLHLQVCELSEAELCHFYVREGQTRRMRNYDNNPSLSLLKISIHSISYSPAVQSD